MFGSVYFWHSDTFVSNAFLKNRLQIISQTLNPDRCAQDSNLDDYALSGLRGQKIKLKEQVNPWSPGSVSRRYQVQVPPGDGR